MVFGPIWVIWAFILFLYILHLFMMNSMTKRSNVYIAVPCACCLIISIADNIALYYQHHGSLSFIVELMHIGRLARMSVLDTEVDGSNPDNSMLFP